MNLGGSHQQQHLDRMMQIVARHQFRSGGNQIEIARRYVLPQVDHAFGQQQAREIWKPAHIGFGAVKAHQR